MKRFISIIQLVTLVLALIVAFAGLMLYALDGKYSMVLMMLIIGLGIAFVIPTAWSECKNL